MYCQLLVALNVLNNGQRSLSFQERSTRLGQRAASSQPSLNGRTMKPPVLPDLLTGHSPALHQLVEGGLRHLEILREVRDGHDLRRRRDATGWSGVSNHVPSVAVAVCWWSLISPNAEALGTESLGSGILAILSHLDGRCATNPAGDQRGMGEG